MTSPHPLTVPWTAFIVHCFTVAHESGLSVQPLERWVGPFGSALPPEGGVAALQTFFATPSHRVGVQTLNCSLFLTPIPFSGHPVPLGDILTFFSGLRGVCYGRVWTHLIDVAENAGVTDVGPARDFVRQQMTASGTVVPVSGTAGPAPTGNPSTGSLPFDGILQSVVAAFPGLSDCMDNVVGPLVSQLMQGSDGGGGPSIGSIGEVQLKPMIETLARTLYQGDGDLSGPIQQILGGIKGLSDVFASALSGG